MGNEDDIVRKVQALWRKVDDPAATEAEKKLAADKARELLAKYAIDELVLSEASETGEPIVIGDLFLGALKDNGDWATSELVPEQRMKLAHYIAQHHRLRSIITTKWNASVEDDGTPIMPGKYLQLIGYRSDVTMTRALNQGLSIDMIVAMSMEPTSHMTAQDRKFYQMSFCDGYASRIEQRLAEVDRRVEEVASEGNLLPVLANRKEAVDKFVDDMYGKLKSTREKVYRFDPNAARRGAKAAEKANIGLKGVGGNRGELT